MKILNTNNTNKVSLAINNPERNEINKGAAEDQNIEGLGAHEIDNLNSSNKVAATNSTSEILLNPSTKANFEYIDKFIDWKFDVIISKVQICKNMTQNVNVQDSEKREISIIPKCLEHYTRKLCNCDPICLKYSYDDLSFYRICTLYDFENIYTDDKYIEGCDKYDYRPINKKLVKYDVGKHVDKAKDIFFKKLEELCDNASNINAVRCSAYELRDECFNNLKCLSDAVSRDIKSDCKNEDFENQINEISKILNVELMIRSPEDLFVRQDLVHYGRRLHSTEEIYTVENSTETKDFDINTVVPVSVTGIVLISLLGLYSVKNKKNKMKLGCGLTGAFIIIISLIIYLISSGIFN